MDDIRLKRPKEGPIVDLHKGNYRQSLNKIFGTQVEKSMVYLHTEEGGERGKLGT